MEKKKSSFNSPSDLEHTFICSIFNGLQVLKDCTLLRRGFLLPGASSPTQPWIYLQSIPLLCSIIASHLYFSKQLLKNGLGARLLNPVFFLSSWAFALHLALQCILDRERENVAGLVSRPLGAQLPTAPSCAQLWSAACPALPRTTITLLLLSKPHTHPINSLCSEASFKWGNEPSVI